MMTNFGETFRIIRTLKKILPKQVAADLNCDEKTIRDIELGKTQLVSKRFKQLCDYYKIEPDLVFSVAAGKASFQNFVYNTDRNGLVDNYVKDLEKDIRDKYITILKKQVEQLQTRISILESKNDNL